MALLDPVHWQVVTPTMRELLRFIGRQPFAERFYLAGGTALALRLGHRVSVDLDFFAQGVSLSTLLQLGETKYPYARDFELMAVESLVLFENADRDIQPTLLVEVAWGEVRQFFTEQARALGQSWFGSDDAETDADQ